MARKSSSRYNVAGKMKSADDERISCMKLRYTMSSSELGGLQYLFSLVEDIEHMLLLVGKGIEWRKYIYLELSRHAKESCTLEVLKNDQVL